MISDASPLIFLGRIGQLALLKRLFGSVVIPIEVRTEILVEGRPATIAVSNAIDEGWIKAAEVKNNPEIGIKGGERHAINLARERKDHLLIDDAIAIKAAKALGIETIRTTTVIFMAAGKGIISKKEAVSLINKLIDAGYYISPKYYSVILGRLGS